MKKVLKYLSLMFAFLLVLTGCNFSKKNSNSKEELADNLEKTGKATNFSEKVTVDFSMEQEGKKIAANATVDGKVYTEGDKKLMSADITAGASGMTVSGKLYADIDKTSAKLYINYMGQWMKLDAASLGIDFSQISSEATDENLSAKEILDYAKETKEVKSDKDGQKKYNVTLDKEKLNKKAVEAAEKAVAEAKKNSQTGTVTQVDPQAEDELAEIKKGVLAKDITFALYTKDGYVTGFEMDLATIIDSIGMNEEELAEIKKMNLTGKIKVELSDFGKVSKIEIPAEALNGTDATKMLGSM
jgi:hypothetical protein